MSRLKLRHARLGLPIGGQFVRSVTRRVREFAVKHPVIADVVVAVVVAVVSLPATVGGDKTAGVLEPGTGVAGFGWLWFVAVHVPLAWRRRAPVVVFWTVLGLVAACTLAGVTGVFFVFAPLVALYAVTRHRSVRQLWPAVAALTLALGAAWWREPSQWPAIGGCWRLSSRSRRAESRCGLGARCLTSGPVGCGKSLSGRRRRRWRRSGSGWLGRCMTSSLTTWR